MITVSVTVFLDCLNTFLEMMPLFCEKTHYNMFYTMMR